MVCVHRQGRWWRHRGFRQNVVYEYPRRTREWCVCIVRVEGGAIGSEDFNRMRCTNSQGGREGVCVCALGRPRYERRTREWCVCIIRVDGGAIGSEDFNRMRCMNSQGRHEGVCVTLGRPLFSGIVTPPFLVPSPTPSPAMHTYVYVGCASYIWLSSGSCRVPKGRCNDCSEGIRSMKAHSSMHAT